METSNNDAPDRSYWTPYDHFMIERDARNMRSAYVGAVVARLGKRLWLHLLSRIRDLRSSDLAARERPGTSSV
jgi:hypothetical protein